MKLVPIAATTQKVAIRGRVPSISDLRPTLSIIKTLQIVPNKLMKARGMFRVSALSSFVLSSKVTPVYFMIKGP